MLKRIATVHLRQELSSVLNSVQNNGEEYILERAGRPLAAVVPVGVALRREQAKNRLRNAMKQRTCFDEMSARAFDRMIDDELQAVRRIRRRRLAS